MKEAITFIALSTNDDIIIIDAEREYGDLIRALGGVVIEISPSSPHHINPLEIARGYGTGENPVAMKSELMMSICEQQMGAGQLGAFHKSIIDRCTANVYHDLIKSGGKARQPILSDWRNEVKRQEEREAQELALASELFVEGSLNMFAHETNVDIANRIVSFDLYEMGEQLKPTALKRAGKAAKNTAAARRVVQAVTKAVASLVSSLIGLVGGGILLIVLVVVIIIAAVANSPFGLFFAEERSAPDTVSVAEAVGTVNVAYNTKLEELQAGDYDSIDVTGAAADWPDVLAVFAARYAGAEDGIDVATLDADRVSKLTATFWDMTALTSTVETIDHPDSDPDDDTDDSWTERILHLTITAKTAEDMKTAYGFTAYQISALDELLADRAALSSLAGSLAITNADVREVLAALPADLEQARRDTVQTALQLVGKVNYFWGGKSRAIGWDSRWGQLTKVWAAGSSTTGTYRPFGLDCSGFVDWTFNNSLGYIIGHGGGVIMQHRYCTDISQSAAQPGDLAFYPDDSHIGIIVGRNEAGKLLVCHCASGQNNVVITEFSVSGFTAVGRPDIFD